MAKKKNKDSILNDRYKGALERYKRISQRLDKQMYRLEQAAKKDEYKGILNYAYRKMVQEIQNWSPGNTRWGKTVPGGKDVRQKLKNLEKKISVMEHFANLPSFSLKGIKSGYVKAAKTTNEKYGVNLKWQDYANYYTSATAEYMDTLYGSDTVVKALGKFKKMSSKKKQKLVEEIKNNPNKQLDSDKAVSEAIKELLKQDYKF